MTLTLKFNSNIFISPNTNHKLTLSLNQFLLRLVSDPLLLHQRVLLWLVSGPLLLQQ